MLTWDAVDTAIAETDGISPDQIAQLDALFPKFKLFSDAFVAEEATVEGMTTRMLHCTASSTITDLHGDDMTLACVQDMAKQAKRGPAGKGLTIFLNHQYRAPEDVAGRVVAAAAQNSGEKDADTGADIWDLHYDIRLTNNNDRVKQVFSQIKDDGISLGVSIGAYILEYDYKDKEKGYWGGLIINKLLLVETSIVGIPANQRSWVQNGDMAIGKHIGLKSLFESNEPDRRLEKRLWKVLDGVTPAPGVVVRKEAIPVKKDAVDLLLAGKPSDDDNDAGKEPDDDEDDKKSSDPATDASAVTDEAQPDAAETAPAEESTVEATTQPGTTEAAGGEAPVEASKDLEIAAPEIAAALKEGVTPATELLLSALEHAAGQVAQLKAEKAQWTEREAVLTGERDKAIKDVEMAAEIIVRVAKSPLGRKTQFKAPVQSFQSKFAGIYDQAFLKLLDQESES